MESLIQILDELRSAINRIGGGGHDGDDLFGEVALACVKRIDQYDWSHPLVKGRIIRIARNLHFKALRSKRLRQHAPLQPESCTDLSSGETPVDTEHTGLSCADYAAAVNRLSDPYRFVIHEHITKGRRLVAIAKDLNVPSATVRTRFHRALRKLAKDPAICESDVNPTR